MSVPTQPFNGNRETAADVGASVSGQCRKFMSGFPTGVAVVSGLDAQARPRGVTCTSLLSVTITPPTLTVSINVRSGTLEAIRCLGGFGVNLLPAGGRGVAELFASGRPDRFSLVRWQPRGKQGLPWLVDCCRGWAECEVREILIIEDHALVVGRVIDAQSTSETPLIYGFRSFSAWRPSGS